MTSPSRMRMLSKQHVLTASLEADVRALGQISQSTLLQVSLVLGKPYAEPHFDAFTRVPPGKTMALCIRNR